MLRSICTAKLYAFQDVQTNIVRGKINQVQKNDSSLIGLTLTHKFNLLPPIPYYSKGNRFMLKYNWTYRVMFQNKKKFHRLSYQIINLEQFSI